MKQPDPSECAPAAARDTVTHLLVDLRNGRPGVMDSLIPLVYAELRRLAVKYLRGERPDHTLQPTALVHEAFLRLVDQSVAWQNRGHFFGIAAQAMRRILVDHARRRGAQKRAGGRQTTLDESVASHAPTHADVLMVDEALDRLAQLDPRPARVVELRFFGGLTVEESAEALGVSPATVKRDWLLARAWLQRELAEPVRDP